MEAVTPATRFPELEAIVRDYSPYLFSPLPGELLKGPVSDYFTAWDGGLAGFIASRAGHPFFTVEGGDLVGWIDYFDAAFDDARPPRAPGRPFGRAGRGPPRRLRPARQTGQPRTRQSLESRRLVQLVPLFRQARLARRPRERRGRGERPRSAALRRLPGRRRLRDRDRGLDVGQARVTPIWPGWPGPSRTRASGPASGPPRSARRSRRGSSPTTPIGWSRRAGGPSPATAAGARRSTPSTRPTQRPRRGSPERSRRSGGRDSRTSRSISCSPRPCPERGGSDVTPIQAYREGMRVIRKAAGDDFVLACGAPLLPSAGLVDGDAHRRRHGALLEDQALALPGPERLFRAEERPDAPVHAPGFLAQRSGLPAAAPSRDRAHPERTGALRPGRRGARQPHRRQRQARRSWGRRKKGCSGARWPSGEAGPGSKGSSGSWGRTSTSSNPGEGRPGGRASPSTYRMGMPSSGG